MQQDQIEAELRGFIDKTLMEGQGADLTSSTPLFQYGILDSFALFSLIGFIIGLWADGFEKLQLIPLLIITPLTFLGGSFYSIHMLPPFWQTVTLFNPVVYLISGFRWSFYGQGDVSVGASLGFTALFIAVCLTVLAWIFHTGWRLKP